MKLRYKITVGILIFVFLFFSAVAVSISYTADCPPAAEAASGSTMKAVVYRCYGGPDVLEYADIPMPVPAEHEVLVKVHAAGVNPLDWHFMRGSPFVMRLMTGIGAPKDAALGRDFAGVVEAVGENVTRFKAGDRVYGGANGAFAEYLEDAQRIVGDMVAAGGRSPGSGAAVALGADLEHLRWFPLPGEGVGA